MPPTLRELLATGRQKTRAARGKSRVASDTVRAERKARLKKYRKRHTPSSKRKDASASKRKKGTREWAQRGQAEPRQITIEELIGRPEKFTKAANDALSVEAAVKAVTEKWEEAERKPTAARTAGKKVSWTEECQRIADLVVWDWYQDPNIEQYVNEFTQELKRKKGTMTLRPVQAAMFHAMRTQGGAFGAVGVGEGKTIVSFVAGIVLKAKRVVLLIPAKLRDKTHIEFAELKKHWRSPTNIEIVSYEFVSHPKHKDLLRELNPDLIIADEVHKLKNESAACTRRVRDFMARRADCAFVGMSGTVTNRSLYDFVHILRWCLKPAQVPLPRPMTELHLWAKALDEKIKKPVWIGDLNRFIPRRERERFAARVAAHKDGKSKEDPNEIRHEMLQETKSAVGRRIFQSPGIVRTKKKSVEASIIYNEFSVKLSAEIKLGLAALQEEKSLVMLIKDERKRLPFISRIWQKARQLVCGFQYRQEPPPPKEWQEVKTTWDRFVLDIMRRDLPGLDSRSLIALAAKGGRIGEKARQIYEDWIVIKPTYSYVRIVDWIDDSPLRDLQKRLEGPTLIWVDYEAVGDKLSEITGFPYFQSGGKDKQGNLIEEFDPKRSAILSITSNMEGRNLQAWSRNFVVTPPSVGTIWEQVIGRTHRQGQLEDEVFFDVMMGSAELEESIAQARKDAEHIYRMTETPQKLLLVDNVTQRPQFQSQSQSQ